MNMDSSLNKQSKCLVKSLIEYFEQERDNKGPLLPLHAVKERVANALGLSIRTVFRISSTAEVESPKRTRSRPKSLTIELNPVQKTEIRNEIYECAKTVGEHITLNTLLEKLKSKSKYEGSRSSLAIVLKDIGFKYKKDDPRRGIMERDHIVHARIKFLLEYTRNMENKLYECVFIDETWVFQDGINTRSWQDSNVKSVRKTKVDGKRYIILHAGTSRGWIPEALLMFSGKSDNPDYHGEMNEDNFLKWFEFQLLQKLENPSLIIMDNASYHSTISKQIPKNHWKKEEIVEKFLI